MNAKHSVHMSLKAENPDHVRVWEMIQNRDREKFPIISDYIVDIMIHAQEKKERKDRKETEQPEGLRGIDMEAWKNELLDAMEKRFRIILRGPVGK